MGNLVTPNTSDTQTHRRRWLVSPGLLDSIPFGHHHIQLQLFITWKNPNSHESQKTPNPETPHNSPHWKLDFLCLCQKCSIQVFFGGGLNLNSLESFRNTFFQFLEFWWPRNPSCWLLLRRLPWKNFRESHGLGNRLHQRTCPGRCKRC